mmetsp:Transcript_74173/g.197797  ORF Transcript_74173/g.197797 Transcript_74173/m.197797 type:complete len:545 (-) Transcript_74173:20-1654(-)
MATSSYQPSTVGEFIVEAFRKELCGVWSLVEPERLHYGVLLDVTEQVAPSLCADVVEIARGWMPGLNVHGGTLLPDLNHFPSHIEDLDPLPLQLRQLLMESMDVYFTNMDLSEVYSLHPDLKTEFLTRTFSLHKQGVFSFCAQVMCMLEHIWQMRPTTDVVVGESGALEPISSRRPPTPMGPEGSVSRTLMAKHELVNQLQQAIRKIFFLEREVTVRARSEKEKISSEKEEKARCEKRLMDLNEKLKEQLRVRTEELKAAETKLMDVQRGIAHNKAMLSEKAKKIAVLEGQRENSSIKQEDLVQREKEYGKRLLQLAAEEDEALFRDSQRIKRLSHYIAAGTTVRGPTQGDVVTTRIPATVQKVQQEFEEFFSTREKQFEAVLKQYESDMDEKKAHLAALRDELIRTETTQECTRKGLLKETRNCRSVEVQAQLFSESMGAGVGPNSPSSVSSRPVPPTTARNKGARQRTGMPPSSRRLPRAPDPVLQRDTAKDKEKEAPSPEAARPATSEGPEEALSPVPPAPPTETKEPAPVAAPVAQQAAT